MLPVVSGSTINVRRWAFCTSVETITHGLVFLISDPRVGFRETRKMSPLEKLSSATKPILR